jgi:hypothetical protein
VDTFQPKLVQEDVGQDQILEIPSLDVEELDWKVELPDVEWPVWPTFLALKLEHEEEMEEAPLGLAEITLTSIECCKKPFVSCFLNVLIEVESMEENL